MNPILLYWIEVNIALSLFYLSCATILRRDTFLQARRFFFLAAILFSFLYPFFPVQTISDFWISATESRGAEAGVWIEEPSMALLMEEGSGVSAMTVPWQKILFWIYSVVVLLLLSRFSGQLMSILRVRMKSVKRFVSGVPVYQLKEDIPPFSFFRWIFVHAESHTGAELKQILLHEQTHARQWHSMDIVLAELLCIFFWWNPFVWLMKREMAINLEYVADKNVLREGVDTREYQYHLLRLTYPGSAAFIVNNFNVSRLKQRIMMMNKTKSPALTLAKYLVIFPLAFLLVAVNSCTNQSKKSGEDAATESVAPASDEQDALPGDKTKDNTEEDAEVFVVVEDSRRFLVETRL